MLFNHLGHVPVGIPDFAANGALSVFPVQRLRDLLHLSLPAFEFLRVMIPQNVLQHGFRHVPLHVRQMIESLVPFRAGRNLLRRQHGVGLHRHQLAVDHLSLGGPGMHGKPGNRQLRRRRVERFVFHHMRRGSVHRISVLRPERLQIQQARSVPDLLVRAEADADRPVRDLFRNQPLGHRHDFRDAGLVVRPQHGRPVRRHDRLPDALLQMRKLLRIQHLPGRPQRDLPAVIVPDHLRVRIRSPAVVHRIQMRVESQRRHLFAPRRSRNESVHIGMLVHPDPFQPQRLHLICQQIGQVELSLSGGNLRPVLLAAGSIDRNILQQPFICSHASFFSFCSVSRFDHGLIFRYSLIKFLPSKEGSRPKPTPELNLTCYTSVSCRSTAPLPAAPASDRTPCRALFPDHRWQVKQRLVYS